MKTSTQLDNIIGVFKILAKIPSLVGGKLNNVGRKITATWSVKNLDKGRNTRYVSSYLLDDSLRVLVESDFGVDVSNELLSAVSPQENFKALIRKATQKQYLEVWNKNTLTHSVDLTALDIHGQVYADADFGCLDWSHDETSLVYVAEKKMRKPESYINRKSKYKTKKDGSKDSDAKKGEMFLYRQDWGEQLVGKHFSVIVLCKLPTETFTVLQGLPDSWCPGQVRFSPDGNSVVGVAWETQPHRLGLLYATNRPSWIFSLTFKGNVKKLSEDGMAVRSPRYSPLGDLVWIQRKAGGPHHACHQLVINRKGTTKVTTLIDIVQTEMAIENGQKFYGLFCKSLPGKCFSADGTRILFSTPQKTEIKSYAVQIGSGKIVDISNNTTPGNINILDVRTDVILAAYCNMTTPAQLHVAKLPPAGSETKIKWVRVSNPREVPPSVASSAVEYLDFVHKCSKDTVNAFNALYFAPKAEEGKKLPLLVWPHGGPHNNFINGFSFEAAFFNMLGFATLLVNYRGSTGAGEASVRCLLKNVGDYDVKDCKLATEEVVKTRPVDGKKLALRGGSHGGFLVTHLSGQYPDMYRVVVARNPVIDMASMFNFTDIPDWCAVEAGYELTEKGPMSDEQLVAMRRCSPLAHVHKVRAPTALMLGMSDKRVLYHQGLEYGRRLKANGVQTRIYVYNDNHSLSSTPTVMDRLINGAQWLIQHLH